MDTDEVVDMAPVGTEDAEDTTDNGIEDRGRPRSRTGHGLPNHVWLYQFASIQAVRCRSLTGGSSTNRSQDVKYGRRKHLST